MPETKCTIANRPQDVNEYDVCDWCIEEREEGEEKPIAALVLLPPHAYSREAFNEFGAQLPLEVEVCADCAKEYPKDDFVEVGFDLCLACGAKFKNSRDWAAHTGLSLVRWLPGEA